MAVLFQRLLDHRGKRLPLITPEWPPGETGYPLQFELQDVVSRPLNERAPTLRGDTIARTPQLLDSQALGLLSVPLQFQRQCLILGIAVTLELPGRLGFRYPQR